METRTTNTKGTYAQLGLIKRRHSCCQVNFPELLCSYAVIVTVGQALMGTLCLPSRPALRVLALWPWDLDSWEITNDGF